MKTAKPSRVPMLVSAFVYPGAGQFVQKRRIAGTAYALLFTICIGFLFYDVFRPLVVNVIAALDWADAGTNRPFEELSVVGVLVPFLAGLLVYVMNLADVARANRRTLRPPPIPPEINDGTNS